MACKRCNGRGLRRLAHYESKLGGTCFCECRAGDALLAQTLAHQTPRTRQQRPHDHPGHDLVGDGAEREPLTVSKDEV